MVFADVNDLVARLRRPLTTDETAAAPGLLEEASVLVEGYCNQSFDPVPSAVRVATSRIVARALTAPVAEDSAPVSSEQFTAGPFTMNRSYTGEGSNLWVGATEKTMLRRHRISMSSVSTVSDRVVCE